MMTGATTDEHIRMDHYRRERSRKLMEIAVSHEIAPPLEQSDLSPTLSRSRSSPNLFDTALESKAPKVPPIPKARASQSFALPRIRTVTPSPQSPASDTSQSSLLTPSNVSSLQSTLGKYTDKLHFLIPERLAYAALSPAEIASLKDDSQYLNVSVVSSYLHRQYVPLCADFGPVTINIVHRFCQARSYCCLLSVKHAFIFVGHHQAMGKRVSKAGRTGGLVIYCLEKEKSSIANASFLLASFLLLVIGQSVEEAAAPFTGTSAPYSIAAFRDASFCRQVFKSALEPDT